MFKKEKIILLLKKLVSREIRNQLLIVFIWLVLVTLLRWRWHWSLIFLWLGGIMGHYLLDLDHLLYALWIYPHELTSMRFKRLLEQSRFRDAIDLLADTRQERKRLTLHSVVFQAVLPIFSFFVLTSTGSMLGAGLVMGLYLRSLEGLFTDFRKLGHIKNWFWQVRGEVPQQIQALYFVGMVIIFVLLSLLLI